MFDLYKYASRAALFGGSIYVYDRFYEKKWKDFTMADVYTIAL